VILIDLPGFGQTPRPVKSYTIYDYATFVEHFLAKIEQKQVTIIGHSFGGRIGIILAATTDILDKLILVDSAAVETKSFAIKTRIFFNKLAIIPIKILFPQKVELLKKHFGGDDYQEAGSLRDIFIKTVNEDLTPLLQKILIRTLIIWGEKDNVRPITEAKIIEKHITNAQLRVVWDAGHSPFLEKPEEFMTIIEEELC
jgi:pimeloyl-ACP methyl ester carboxylesterase